MLSFILKRVLATVPVMGVVALTVFLLLRLSPGDPAAVIAGDYATAEQIEKIRAQLGLNEPIILQFINWLGDLLRGDLGVSIFSNLPVTTLIAQRIEPTLMLALSTIIFSIVVAVPLGVLAAWKAHTWVDRAVMVFAVVGFSVPVFVMGYFLIYGFAIGLRWFPVQGYRSPFVDPGLFISHIALPTLALSAIFIALIARITRASVLEVLEEDYIRTARAKGQTERRVLLRHALANAAVPIVTVIGLGVALLIGGVVVTESVFNIPGLGRTRGRRDPQARLPDHPGPDPVLLVPLHRVEPPDRHRLHPARPEDPLLSETAKALPVGATMFGHWRPLAARYPFVVVAAMIVLFFVLAAVFAPLLWTTDPLALNPLNRLKPPSAANWFGTDQFGRDLWTRTVYGTRVSLIVGVAVAILSISIGLVVGMLAGYIRLLDSIVMRVMDGLMAIPGVLLAIAMVSLSGASMFTVIVAITVPEIPRVVRLVRAVVLTVREEPYVEAAIAAGTRLPLILIRHVLPNCVPALIVQATYVCASAMLTEAILSFLGAGTPPEIPSWGNMMAEGRAFFPIAPRIILFPGAALALVILAVNVLGDGLRDRLDPKLARRV